MNVVVYGNAHERETMCELLETHEELVYRSVKYCFYDNYDDFLAALKAEQHLVIVTTDGAAGMEGVIAARAVRPDAAVLWFSNDRAFGPQSYRLGCTYFSQKPLTSSVFAKAIRRWRE